MKTVMKKMFSLMLVAVLLVSAVPAAFADDTAAVTCDKEGCENFGGEVTRQSKYDNATCTESGNAGYYCKKGHIVRGEEIPALGHQTGNSATCTTGATCGVCGETISEPDPTKHNYGGWETTTPATCSAAGVATRVCSYNAEHTDTKEIPVDSNAHKFVNGKCEYCAKCEGCGRIGDNCNCCSACGATNGGHTDSCTVGCNKSATCDSQWDYGHKDGCESQNVCKTCGKTGHYEQNCPNTICPHCKASMANKKHEAGCLTLCDGERDCPNEAYSGSDHHNAGCKYAYCNEPGCTKKDGHSGEHTGSPCEDENCSFSLGHDGKHSYQCPNEGCDKAINHDGLCSNEYEGGTSKVKVHVNIYNADTYKYTKELVVYYEDPDTAIHDSITTHKALIQSELEAQYPGYTWESGHIYKDVKGTKAVSSTEDVDEGVTVYINAYSNENFVFIMVHNSRSMSYIDLIPLHGVKFGDTVTKSEVKKAVSAKYNITSLSMYSEQAWEDYVAGKTVNSVDSIKITRGESDLFFIDVRISGTAKSSSGSGSGAAADSSNPKTGDMIFTPVVVMGTSVACLAVLFYLNKKRAY